MPRTVTDWVACAVALVVVVSYAALWTKEYRAGADALPVETTGGASARAGALPHPWGGNVPEHPTVRLRLRYYAPGGALVTTVVMTLAEGQISHGHTQPPHAAGYSIAVERIELADDHDQGDDVDPLEAAHDAAVEYAEAFAHGAPPDVLHPLFADLLIAAVAAQEYSGPEGDPVPDDPDVTAALREGFVRHLHGIAEAAGHPSVGAIGHALIRPVPFTPDPDDAELPDGYIPPHVVTGPDGVPFEVDGRLRPHYVGPDCPTCGGSGRYNDPWPPHGWVACEPCGGFGRLPVWGI